MKFTGFLQKITYCTLCFVLLFSTIIQTAIAEEELQEPITNEITIDEPTTGEAFNTNEIIVSGMINLPDTTIQLFLDNMLADYPIVIADGIWEATLVQLNEGNYELVAKATDLSEQVYTSNLVSFTIDTTAPVIEITNLSEGELTNKTIIEGQTEADSTVRILLDGVEVTDVADPLHSDSNGLWLFDLNGIITEGTHVVTALAIDKAGNEGTSSAIEFTFDQTRPFITPDVFPRAYMTKVSLETVIKVNFVDDLPIIEGDISTTVIEVFKKGSAESVPGTFTFIQKEVNRLEIIFTPDSPLATNQKYYVYTNPFLKDRAGNLVHPRNWSFTTTSSDDSKTPHGNYTNNVNTCSSCHSTHMASDPILKEPSEDLTALVDPQQAFNSYCMACHDGTVAALPANWGESSSHHFQLTTNEGGVESQSCGSCHNPHSDWSESNPNIHQDHFTFEHTTALIGVDEPFLADSNEVLCESCHESDSMTKKLDERVKYNAFAYKNWSSSSYELDEGRVSFGEASDYTLCLRCHNASYEQDYQNIIDIESYYLNDSSGHFITADRVKDGSLLDGHIPCADCHNSHGSTNIKQIKTELGHNNKTTFTQTTEPWTASEERTFCLTCHNNSTEVYGITGSLKETNQLGVEIPEHKSDSTISCASCHGGTSATFIEAAHGPSR